MDTFSHTSNTQRDNSNTIFTSEKLNKSDDLVDTLKDFTINDAKYYVSNSATENDAKCDPESNPETVTHTSDGKEKVTDTSNINSQQKSLSNQNLPVVVPEMNPSINDRIASIGGASQTFSMPATKEVFIFMACGGAWINYNLRQVSWTSSTEAHQAALVML